MAKAKAVLKANDNLELLSYIINQTPELGEVIDLPKQGEDIAPIGKMIMSNQRYKNAFLNTINTIALTVIKRNHWSNPWSFTKRGSIRYGQTVREIVLDLVKAFDYNENFDNKTAFLETQVPNIFNYLHELNFQKYYHTTTSDAQISMAFKSEGDLFSLIDSAIGMMQESADYDDYQINKYMLARRALEGTITAVEIEDYGTKDARERVADIQNVSSLMTFRSRNYNPAGVSRATAFEDQILILNTKFQADMNVNVLATSYFRNDAEFKSNLALIDGFENLDEARLSETLGNQYIPLTSAEKLALADIAAIIVSKEWFMNYSYDFYMNSDARNTEFFNPTTLENHHFLHVWGIYSTSPFENAAILLAGVAPAVDTVSINPSESTVSAGQKIQLTATVATQGFANKAVLWEVVTGEGVTVTQQGLVSIPADFVIGEESAQVTIKATSIYDDTVNGTATITVV